MVRLNAVDATLRADRSLAVLSAILCRLAYIAHATNNRPPTTKTQATGAGIAANPLAHVGRSSPIVDGSPTTKMMK